jgi:membrane protein
VIGHKAIIEAVRLQTAGLCTIDKVTFQAPLARPPWFARVALRFVRSCRLGVRAAGRGVVEFYNSSNLTFASSIAYYALLSFFPFVLLLLTLLGRLAIGMNNETLVQMVMRALPSHFDFVINQIEELSKAPTGRGIVGTVVLFWASMGFFGAITSAVDHAWGVEKPHGFFKHKLIAAIMLVIAALLMIAALAIVSFAEVAETQWFATALEHFPALATLQGFLVRNAATPLFVLIVALIYYFVPNAKVRLRDVWWGALLAGVLWRAAFAGFSWYVRDFSRFSVHGSITAVVVFLVWVYLSAVILLYGVEVSAAYARLRKHLPQEAPAAPVREA